MHGYSVHWTESRTCMHGICSLITHYARCAAFVNICKPIGKSEETKNKKRRDNYRVHQPRLDPRISFNASLANQRHTSCTSLPTRQLPKTTPCCSRTSFARSHRRRQSSSRRLGRGAGGAPADSLTLLLLVRASEGLDVVGRSTLPGVGGHRRSDANW